jgi:hypothetical protein
MAEPIATTNAATDPDHAAGQVKIKNSSLNFEHKAQHAMRGRMLRPEISGRSIRPRMACCALCSKWTAR